MTLLLLENVTASYGKAQALFDVNLNLKEGELMALMGRNGMGKSTTVKVIMRMLRGAGNLLFEGRDIMGLPSHRVAQMGLGLVPEGRRCFRDLTVAENLSASARLGYWSLPRIFELFPRLGERQAQVADSLSGGEQQSARLDCGRDDSANGYKLTCIYFFDEDWDEAAGGELLLTDKAGNETRVKPQADRLVLFRSREMRNAITAVGAGAHRFGLTFWVHGPDEI